MNFELRPAAFFAAAMHFALSRYSPTFSVWILPSVVEVTSVALNILSFLSCFIYVTRSWPLSQKYPSAGWSRQMHPVSDEAFTRGLIEKNTVPIPMGTFV
jgi:hypothetical protein